MATAALWWLWGRIMHALHREEKIENETVVRARMVRAHLAIFMAGLEGHIYLTYLYPTLYPVIHLASRLTGLDLSGMYYGGH